MTEEEFWKIIDNCGWGTESTDYTAIKVKLMKFFDFDALAMDEFSKEVQKKTGILYKLIMAYEESSRTSCGLGDDGFSDLLAHIVGLGQTEYDAVIKEPKLAVDRAQAWEYVESFGYAVPSRYDLQSIRWSTYEESVERAVKDYTAASLHSKTTEIHEDCALICSVLTELIGKKDVQFTLGKKDSVNKALENIGSFTKDIRIASLDIGSHWPVTNLFSDLKTYGEYLR